MAKLDGTNGLIQQYDYQVLTTGFSYTFAAGTQTLIINPAGTLATGTITMPAAPADGMVIWVTTTQQIVALTVNGNTGQTVVSKVTSLAPNQAVAYLYRASNTTWYPFETQMAQGNGPTFSYYQSSAQTLSSNTITKLTFTTADWDTTGGMFASSRFTPTVAGYYQISGAMAFNAAYSTALIYIYKNGSDYKRFTNTSAVTISGLNGSALVYCNGSTDYIELYALASVGQALVNNSAQTYFQGVMVRSA